MMKTIAMPFGQDPVNVEMTAQEIQQAQADDAAHAADMQETQWRREREAAYAAKGWNNAYDLMDDIFKRGMDAVKADRDAIKAEYPKAPA